MKKLLTTLMLSLVLMTGISFGQGTSCGTAIPLADGACLTNQQFPGTVNMSGLCVGGNNPSIYISFVAGNCSQFNITSPDSHSTVGARILTSGCSYVGSSLSCKDNVISNMAFTHSGISTAGADLLTPGQTYVLHLWGPVGTSLFDICYEANAGEEADNDCSGATALGTSTQTFFNGGDCSYAGSYDDNLGGETDPTPIDVCAGSLENTQWITFTPMAGTSSFQIVGSNINCTGGGCGFQFGLFSGSCGSLVDEGCFGEKVCSGGQSSAGPISNNAGANSVTWNATGANGFTVTITSNGAPYTGTENFYLVMDGNADADCTYDLLGINVVALPIELIYFTGRFEDNRVNLMWASASESNNDFYSIEKSYTGEVWETAGLVNGVGNSTLENVYKWSDTDLVPGKTHYYRLKQTDYDGYSETFKIIAVSVPMNYQPNIIGRYTMMGIEVDENYNGVQVIRYSNGTSRKIVKTND